jgi:hypothetical protein
MTSHSDKPKIRKYSVLPARSVQDDELHPTSFRLLAAICLHTNGWGICWPSGETLARHISRSRKTVSVHVGRLIKAGYIRKLQPKAYPFGFKRKNGWFTNRYQVLFEGPATPMPTREQFLAARPLIAENDQDLEAIDADYNQKGIVRGDEALIQSIAQAFRQGVERASGVVRDVGQSLLCAGRLAEKGVQPDQVLAAAVQATIAWRKERRDPPMTLDQVAKWAGLE